MDRELPKDLDLAADRTAKLGAVSGVVAELGIDSIVRNPDITSSVLGVIDEAAPPVPLETELFLEGEARRLVDECGVDRGEALTFIAEVLGEVLAEKLEELRLAEAMQEIDPEKEK